MKPTAVVSHRPFWHPVESPLFRATSFALLQRVQIEAGKSTREELGKAPVEEASD